LALVISNVGFLSIAEAQLTQTKKSLPGTITGKVTLQGKGAPGIVVGLRSGDPGFRPGLLMKATTDQEGNYRLTGISAGSWLVMPFAPRFVVANYSFGATGKMIVLAPGESIGGMDFALLGGGVITGKVTDANGLPLIEERINLIPADSPQPIVGKHPSGSDSWPGVTIADPKEPRFSLTDDRGVYRIFGVAAGHYKVTVGQEQKSGFLTTTRRAYLQTFYPDTTNPAKATLVEVTEGSEVSNIDIIVRRALKSFSAKGQIVTSDTGEPVSGRRWGFAKLTDNQDRSFVPATSPSNKKGEFNIEGLLPGRYAVFVEPDQNAPAYSEPVQFEVQDKDIDGLVIKTQAGATLSGKVMIEGIQDKAFFAKLSQMQLNVYVYSTATALPNWHSAAINPDGSFIVRGLQPGTASINTVSSTDSSLVKNLLILRTERYGVEQPRGIAMKADEQIEGLAVMVAYGTGVVRGEVRYENGVLPPGSRIVVRVTPVDKFNPLTGTDVDARGRFQIDRLPPGSYWLDVEPYLPGGWRGPRPMRQQVNVAGDVTEVTFTLDLKPAG
jgi:hypothetical protein